MGSLLLAGSKNDVFKFGSVNKIVIAPANTGKDNNNNNNNNKAVIATAHTINEICIIKPLLLIVILHRHAVDI
jgi:hypothetical protein